MLAKNRFLFVVLLFFLPGTSFGQEVLESATVTAQGSGFSVRKNILTYDVSRDTSATYMKLRDIVAKMPIVQFDRAKETISVNGKSDICIIVNGRKSLVLNNSNYGYMSDILIGMQIQSISIDTAPQGEFRKYSAVVNICTKSAMADFYAVSTGLSVSDEYNVCPYISTTNRIGRLTTNINYACGLSKFRQPTESTTLQKENSMDGPVVMRSSDKSEGGKGHDNIFMLDASYDIDKKNVLFASVNFNDSHIHNKYDTYYMNLLENRNDNVSTEKKNKADRIEGSLDYQHIFDEAGKKLLTLQYSVENSVFEDKYEKLISGMRNSSLQQLVSADYVHRINSSLEMAANTKMILREYASEQDNIRYLTIHQDVYSADADLTWNKGRFMFITNAAIEYTVDDDVKDKGVSFNASASYYLSSRHSFISRVSHSIMRSGISIRNPIKDESKLGIVTQGNPDIRSQHFYDAYIGYNFTKGFLLHSSIGFHYSRTNNGMYGISSILEDGRLLNTYSNEFDHDSYSLPIYISWRPSNWINITLDYSYEMERFHSYKKTINRDRHEARMYSSFSLLKGTDISLNARLIDSESASGISINTTRIHYIVDGSLYLSQEIGGRYRLGLNVENIFHKNMKTINEKMSDNIYIYTRDILPGRTFTLSFSYRFGNFNDDAKRNSRHVTTTDVVK